MMRLMRPSARSESRADPRPRVLALLPNRSKEGDLAAANGLTRPRLSSHATLHATPRDLDSRGVVNGNPQATLIAKAPEERRKPGIDHDDAHG